MEYRLFIVGSSKSGSTLLQSMLANHPSLTSFTESHFYSCTFLSRPNIPFPPYYLVRPKFSTKLFPEWVSNYSRSLEERISKFKQENKLKNLDLSLSRCTLFGFSPFGLKIHKEFLRFFDEVSDRRNTVGWIEKTPRHLFYIPLIDSGKENTKFIHIIREGKENIESLYRVHKKHWNEVDLNRCIYKWNRSIKQSNHYLNHENHHYVSYERLAHDTENTLFNLCDSLNLPWNDSILNHTASADLIRTDYETWKSNVSGELKIANRFQETFDQQQQNQVIKRMNNTDYGEIMKRIKTNVDRNS